MSRFALPLAAVVLFASLAGCCCGRGHNACYAPPACPPPCGPCG